MKVAIINDTHCGIRNSSDVFLDNAEKFYSDVFFPYLVEHNIRHVLHLGDYYDNRKFINFRALNRNRHHFLKPLRELGITMDIIYGNHDTYYKNTNDVNAPELLLYNQPNVDVIVECETREYDGFNIALVPWINPENYADSIEYLMSAPASVCMGHFEIEGALVHPGMTCQHGLDHSYLKRFDQVYLCTYKRFKYKVIRRY